MSGKSGVNAKRPMPIAAASDRMPARVIAADETRAFAMDID
jgi:hypothetical protein